MPIYEYQCGSCGKHCEFIQKVNDAAKTHCPNCNEDKLKRQVSATSFHLKGTGWYVTDFKGDKKPETKKEDSAKKETTVLETKPEKKDKD